MLFFEGKVPFGDISDAEARQKVLEGQRPSKPRNCSDEMYVQFNYCWFNKILSTVKPALKNSCLMWPDTLNNHTQTANSLVNMYE